MRKALIILGSIAAIAVLGFFTITSPRVMEKNIAWSCQVPTERCLVRMRGMGHVWSSKDNLDRAAHWYQRAAEAGDPAAMFHLGWIFEARGSHDVQAFITALAKAQAPGADYDRALARETAGQKRPGDDILLGSEEPRLSRQNFETAAHWYRRAADAGFAPR